jgi:hypothetical protein
MSKICLPFLGLSMMLFAANVGSAADDKHAAAYQECAKACNDCQRVCDDCALYCAKLVSEGKREHLATLKECLDCATFCSAAGQIVSRTGPQSALICDACAKACNQCAQECEKFPNDEHMKKCAEECRKCQKACEEMLKHVGK